MRGARQVGKTTMVEMLAADYTQFIVLNMEQSADRALFSRHQEINALVQAIFLQKNQQLSKIDETLLFIDEIQTSPEAVAMLRYFYEVFPKLHVIAAGSLPESLFAKGVNFPVGRVDYRVLRPVSFAEFLAAIGEEQALAAYHQIPLPEFAHAKLLKLFHLYTLIGGMPEVVNRYREKRDLTALKPIYEALLTAWFDDVEKYASSTTQIQIMRHAIRSVFFEAGKRIRFQGFGSSGYGGREMGEALRTLEKTLLIRLIYPTVQTEPPWQPNVKKAPRLQVLDTGLMNFVCGLQSELLGTTDLNAHYQGRIVEHIVGQELLSHQHGALDTLHFWTRERTQSTAELDYLCPCAGQMIPVEVKSGAGGRLRSLHQFLEMNHTHFGIRFYAGEISQETLKTANGHPYKLLNLPYYLAAKLADYVAAVK